MKIEDEAVKALASSQRRKILEVMHEGDRTFTDIQEALRLDKGSLTYHMKTLVKAGLLANIYERRTESNPRVYSYYKLTSFGAFALDLYRQLRERRPALRQEQIAVTNLSSLKYHQSKSPVASR